MLHWLHVDPTPPPAHQNNLLLHTGNMEEAIEEEVKQSLMCRRLFFMDMT